MIEVHPLAITSASDHATRIRMGGSVLPSDFPVVGLLFGTFAEQQQQATTVVDCVDMFVNRTPDNGFSIDVQELETKVRLRLQVFPNLKLVGWYAFASTIIGTHVVAHETVAQRCEGNAVFLRFEEVMPSRTSESIPLAAYYCEKAPATNASVFVEAPYRVASTEVENIAIENLMNSLPRLGKTALEVQNEQLADSLAVLARKVAEIIATLQNLGEDGSAGDQTAKFQLMRLAGGISNSLQSLKQDSARSAESRQKDLDLLVLTLANIEKNGALIRAVADSYNVVYSDRGSIK